MQIKEKWRRGWLASRLWKGEQGAGKQRKQRNGQAVQQPFRRHGPGRPDVRPDRLEAAKPVWPPHRSQLHQSQLLELAHAFGWRGYRVNNSRDLVSTLEQAFAGEGPALLTRPIDYRENALLTERFGNIACAI